VCVYANTRVINNNKSIASQKLLRTCRVAPVSFSRHIAAGRRLVVFWPRADRISRSLENLRSVIAEFKSWVTLVVLNPPVKILTDAFGDIGDIPESDAEFDSERHDAAFSRVCGYRAEHIGILAYALWALHIHRKKAGLDLNKPAYFAGVPIILTMDNASTLLPHTASDFRRVFADKGHWPSINSKSVAPNRGEFAKDFAKFIEQNVQKLAPHVDTPVAAMYPQKPHGTFTLPFKASDALFFVCRCIEPSGCVEGCICTCSKCTARKGCLWRSVLKRLVVTCVYRGTHSTYCEGETAVRREQSARLTPYVVSQAQAPLKTPKRIKIVLVFSSSYCGAK